MRKHRTYIVKQVFDEDPEAEFAVRIDRDGLGGRSCSEEWATRFPFRKWAQDHARLHANHIRNILRLGVRVRVEEEVA